MKKQQAVCAFNAKVRARTITSTREEGLLCQAGLSSPSWGMARTNPRPLVGCGPDPPIPGDRTSGEPAVVLAPEVARHPSLLTNIPSPGDVGSLRDLHSDRKARLTGVTVLLTSPFRNGVSVGPCSPARSTTCLTNTPSAKLMESDVSEGMSPDKDVNNGDLRARIAKMEEEVLNIKVWKRVVVALALILGVGGWFSISEFNDRRKEINADIDQISKSINDIENTVSTVGVTIKEIVDRETSVIAKNVYEKVSGDNELWRSSTATVLQTGLTTMTSRINTVQGALNTRIESESNGIRRDFADADQQNARSIGAINQRLQASLRNWGNQRTPVRIDRDAIFRGSAGQSAMVFCPAGEYVVGLAVVDQDSGNACVSCINGVKFTCRPLGH